MIEYYIIAGGIAISLIGFIIGTIFVVKSYKQSPSIIHYKNIIDKLTLGKSLKKKVTQKKDDKNVEEESGRGLSGMIGNLVGGVIVIFIGLSLLPIISSELKKVSTTNTELSNTLLTMVPLFFGLAVLCAAIGIVYTSLRSSGVV